MIALGLALDEELIVLSKVPHDENLAQLEIGLGLLEGLPLRLGCEVVDEQLLELLGEVLGELVVSERLFHVLTAVSLHLLAHVHLLHVMSVQALTQQLQHLDGVLLAGVALAAVVAGMAGHRAAHERQEIGQVQSTFTLLPSSFSELMH